MSLSTTKTRDWDSTGQAIVKKINKALGSTAWQGESISSFDSTSITTAISEGSLVEGGLYKIPDGVNDNYLYVRALDASTFEPNGVYYNSVLGGFCNVACSVTQSGLIIKSNDPTVSIDATGFYASGDLNLDNLIGIGELRLSSSTLGASAQLVNITGGFVVDGPEITIFFEDDNSLDLEIDNGGNILITSPLPCRVADNNINFVTLKKRGSIWTMINYFI